MKGARSGGARTAPIAALLAATVAATSGCALSGGAGWASRTPDAAPRALKLSGRGPMSREGPLVVGAELGVDVDEDRRPRVRQGAALVGGRLRDPELGDSSPSLEIAGALGVGRESFDAAAKTFGPLVGVRVDAPLPIGATPSASSDRMRAFFLGFEIVPYAHADLVFPAGPGTETVAPGVEAGAALRATLGSDMTLMDVFHQVF